MVNIVEFEETTSPKRRKHLIQDASILSTPFKHDEPNESKITNLNFTKKNNQSKSVLGNNCKSIKAERDSNEEGTSSRATPIVGAGIA